MRPHFLFSLVLAFCWIHPRQALAHVPFAGLNELYNGLLHPVVVPAHLLLIIAVGLFLGKQKSTSVGASLLVFGVGTLGGLLLTLVATGGIGERYILSLAAIFGFMLASNLRLPYVICLVIAAGSGFLLGLDSVQTVLAGKAKFFSLLGCGLGICFLFLYPLAFSDYFDGRKWQNIGVRVVGSWVAASAILVLALSLQQLLG